MYCQRLTQRVSNGKSFNLRPRAQIINSRVVTDRLPDRSILEFVIVRSCNMPSVIRPEANVVCSE